MKLTGYLHPQYAKSMKEFGTPLELPSCGGWILKRPIDGFPYYDGMGCYPLFACKDWSKINADLEKLDNQMVSVSLVVDPFGDYKVSLMKDCFNIVTPFKHHFVADLSQPIDKIVASHHRHYAKKSLKNISVDKCLNPSDLIDEWVSLYSELVNRHELKGIKAFSRESFAKQFDTPGIVMYRAQYKDQTVGAQLFFVQNNVAYYHLAAFNPLGYSLSVSYGLLWRAIEDFAGQVEWLNLGGSAGVSSNGTDGLAVFKKGWSTGTLPVYFCGRIIDSDKYEEILKVKGIPQTDYFPAYREGEF